MAESDPHEIEGASDPPAPVRTRRRLQFPAPPSWARAGFGLDHLRLGAGAWLEREIEAGRGFLWLPVAFGVGSLLYFALPSEPSIMALAALALGLWWLAWARRHRTLSVRLVILLAMAATGAVAIKLRTDTLATIGLERQVTGTLTGWVEERKARRGGYRLTIRVATLDARRLTAIPQRVTVTVRGRDVPKVGDGVQVLARLRPASGPVLPGGYDFARDAYYRGVGATGFAYGAAKPAELGPPPLTIRLRQPIEAIREAIRARIVASLSGESRYIASALIIGDAGGLSEQTEDEMRLSGLAHVLSVSGLHMALVSGVIFWGVRAGLALVPSLALRRPIRKWAAVAALLLSGFYLLISGLDVAAQRSFVMTSIAFLAILADRRAISMRNVALAGLVVLVVTPESILSASFQMSFAATVALVAGFEILADRRRLASTNGPLPRGRGAVASRRLLLFGGGMVVTSLLGGIGTTPFALYHFQRMAPLSILANVAAMPLTDFLIMPFALLSVLAMPFGLEALPLAVVHWGIDVMLVIAATVSRWSGQSGGMAMPGAGALLVFVAGFVWLALWRERWRLLGLMPMALGVALALFPARPGLLVSADGRQLALRGEDGRYVMLARKPDRFVTDIWLRSDGDPRDRAAGGVVQAGGCDAAGCVGRLPGGALVALAFDRAAFEEDCRRAALVVTPLVAPAGCGVHTTVIDRRALERSGSIALVSRPREPADPALISSGTGQEPSGISPSGSGEDPDGMEAETGTGAGTGNTLLFNAPPGEAGREGQADGMAGLDAPEAGERNSDEGAAREAALEPDQPIAAPSEPDGPASAPFDTAFAPLDAASAEPEAGLPARYAEIERDDADEDVIPVAEPAGPPPADEARRRLEVRFEVTTAYAPLRRPWMPRYEPVPDGQ
ncbi:ComEC/Rec2 family competence protein [Kaistia granuli]|uniref:ComEC/Rec2 family competence protein n=1 Tax=Kaistia granuli TaxID=363259 RepID=UPI00036A1BB6|nr:ComEC/Rec2 family competence protein [Kaistia granuli]